MFENCLPVNHQKHQHAHCPCPRTPDNVETHPINPVKFNVVLGDEILQYVGALSTAPGFDNPERGRT
jgi:hypothetical protein